MTINKTWTLLLALSCFTTAVAQQHTPEVEAYLQTLKHLDEVYTSERMDKLMDELTVEWGSIFVGVMDRMPLTAEHMRICIRSLIEHPNI